MKKISAILLALIMMLSMVSFAEEIDYTITISNSVKDETYTAYKVLDLVYSDAGFAYTIDSSSPWFPTVNAYTGLTKTQVNDTTTYVVAKNSAFDAATFAATLRDAGVTATVAGTETGNDAEITIDVTESGAGYYFVDTTLGSLCSLDNTAPNATIREKNVEPTIEKAVKNSETDAQFAASTDANIGETLTYQLTVNVGTGTDKDYTVTDTPATGVTLNADAGVTVKIGGTEIPATTTTGEGDDAVTTVNYTVEMTGTSLKVVLKNDGILKDRAAGTQIVITYTGALNDAAVIAGDGNVNTAKIEYSEQEDEATATVYTYSFKLNKVDGSDNPLAGATFEFPFYVKSAADTTDGAYIYAGTTAGNGLTNTLTTTATGEIVIKGVKNDNYVIEETVAPVGYNILTDTITVNVNGTTVTYWNTSDADETSTGNIMVVNVKGEQLPETGGIGTTIFYTVGGLMMAAALVLLVAKKKVAASK